MRTSVSLSLALSLGLLHDRADAAMCNATTAMDASITASGAGAAIVAASFSTASTFAAGQCTRTGFTCTDKACGTATTCMANYHVSGGNCVPCQPGKTRAAGDPTGGADTSCTGTATGCLENFYQNSTSPNDCAPCSAGTTIASASFGSSKTNCDKPVYQCTEACTTNTGCKANYVQTAGNSTHGGVCTACGNGGTKSAAAFADAGTAKAGYGKCSKAGYTFENGVAAATGCLADYAVVGTATCTSCADTGQSRANAKNFTDGAAPCTGYIHTAATSTVAAKYGCPAGSIQLTTSGAGTTTATDGTCGVCSYASGTAVTVTTAKALFTNVTASFGTCTTTNSEYVFDKNVAIGCAANFIQTTGTSSWGACTRCQGGASANSGTRSGTRYFNIASGWGSCTLTGYRFPTTGASATGNVALGCAKGYVQTAGTSAATLVCSECLINSKGIATGVTASAPWNGLTSDAAAVGAAATSYGRCALSGYVFNKGTVNPDGCARGAVQTGGTSGSDGICTACSNGGTSQSQIFSSSPDAVCAKAGYVYNAANSANSYKAIGCAAGYIQTAGDSTAGNEANVCTACPYGTTRTGTLTFGTGASNWGTCVHNSAVPDAYTFAAGSVSATCKTNFRVQDKRCVACDTGMTRTAGDDPATAGNTQCVGAATGCAANAIQTAENTCTECTHDTSSWAAAQPTFSAAGWAAADSDNSIHTTATKASGSCVKTGYTFTAGVGAATGCAADYIQTSGDATGGTCTACGKSGTKTAAAFAASGTDNAGWGSCTLAGYTFSAGVADPTGCAANYIQTAGSVAGDTSNVCTACEKSGTKTATAFADQYASTKTGWGLCGGAAGYLWESYGVAAPSHCAASYYVSSASGTNDCIACWTGQTGRTAKAAIGSTNTCSGSATGCPANSVPISDVACGWCTNSATATASSSMPASTSTANVGAANECTVSTSAPGYYWTSDSSGTDGTSTRHQAAGCLPDYVQTTGDAATGTCAKCRTGSSRSGNLAFSASDWGACTQTGYAFAAGTDKTSTQNLPTGCAADYIQTAGTSGTDLVCTACSNNGAAVSSTRSGAANLQTSVGAYNMVCTLAGYVWPLQAAIQASATAAAAGAAATGCAANYVQTAHNAANTAHVCSRCQTTGSDGGTATATAFSSTASSRATCSNNGYTFTAGAVNPTGCAAGYIQTGGTGAANGVCKRCSLAHVASPYGTTATTNQGWWSADAGTAATADPATLSVGTKTATAWLSDADVTSNRCTETALASIPQTNTGYAYTANGGASTGEVATGCLVGYANDGSSAATNFCVVCHEGDSAPAAAAWASSTSCSGTHTKCKAGFVQTATSGAACLPCSHGGEAAAADVSSSAVPNAIACTASTAQPGYYWTASNAATRHEASGCIVGYVQTTGGVATQGDAVTRTPADQPGKCEACTHSGTSSQTAFVATGAHSALCTASSSNPGYAFATTSTSGYASSVVLHKALGCLVNFVQTAGDATDGNSANLCKPCKVGSRLTSTAASAAGGAATAADFLAIGSATGVCTLTGYTFPTQAQIRLDTATWAVANVATGCAVNYVQTAVETCTACSNSGVVHDALFQSSQSDVTSTCYAAGYTFSTGVAASTGCAANYIQTAGSATTGTCTACPTGATKAAATWAAEGTSKAGWGKCVQTGYTFDNGVAAATGCAANYVQTASATCSLCDGSATTSATLFSATAATCTKTGWTFGAGGTSATTAHRPTACPANYILTGSGATATCTACPTIGGVAGTRASSASDNKCVIAGYVFSAADIEPTGCAANYVQTAGGIKGTATNACTQCAQNIGGVATDDATASAQNFAASNAVAAVATVEGTSGGSVAVANTAWAQCARTGYTFANGDAEPTGCAAGYVQSAGGVKGTATNACSQCKVTDTANTNLKTAALFAADFGKCASTGYTFATGSATPSGCTTNYVQTAGTNAATGVCTLCTNGGAATATAFGASSAYGTCSQAGFSYTAQTGNCLQNYHVSGGKCIPCAAGTTLAASTGGVSSDTTCSGTATGCAAGSIQTGATACTVCEKSGTSTATTSFASASTGYGTCSATGYTFEKGKAYPIGCAAGYVQSAGGVAAASPSTANVCSMCSNSGTSTASLFAAADSNGRYLGRCSATGYLFDEHHTSTGCAVGYVQTATYTAASGTTAAIANTCTACPASGTAASARWSVATADRSACTGATNGYTYSPGSVTATGCATGYYESAAGVCTLCDATARSCLLRSAKVPTFGTPTRLVQGFSVQITNFDATYTWAGTATASGTVSISSTGLVTVTGVAHTTASVATITATKKGFVTGSAATASTTSLNDPGSYQSYHSYTPPTVAAALPADATTTALATYTAEVKVQMTLAGMSKTDFETTAVQTALKKGFARSYGVAQNQISFTNIVSARRLAARRLAGGVSFTVVVKVAPSAKAALRSTIAATPTATLVNTLKAEMVSAGQASKISSTFGATQTLVAEPTTAPVVAVTGAASQCSLTVAAVLVALAMHA